MDEVPADRRVARTRQALVRAFVELTLANGYPAVTVDRIAERANIGRSTFYTHFQGKDDVLRQSLAYPDVQLASVLDRETTADQLVPLMQHFHEQRRTNRVFFEPPIRDRWIRHLAALLETKLAGRGRPELPLRLVALHLAELQIGLVVHWLSGRASVRPAAIAEALLASTRASASALLKD